MHISKKKIAAWLVSIVMIIFPFICLADNARPLPNDRAFEFSTSFNGTNEIIVQWQIAPGYYLYADRLHISLKPLQSYQVKMPQGKAKYDRETGQYKILSGTVKATILLHEKVLPLQLNVDYQGCSKQGFCYPPVRKSLQLDVNHFSTVPLQSGAALQSLLKDHQKIESVLEVQRLPVLLLIFLGLGMLLAFTPCVLPMVPILASIIAGQKHTINTKKACLLSCTYVLGSALMYALAGMIAALVGSSLQVWLQKPWTIAFMSGIFVLLAFSIFGFFELRMPRQLHHHVLGFTNRQKSGTYLGTFMMGALSTLIVSPCITAPLVGVLIYISQTGSLILGAVLLFVMAIGMGIPLILIGMSVGRWLPKSGRWMEVIKKSFGMVMLAMAVWLLSRVVPAALSMMFWGAWILIFALFLGVYLPRIIGKHKLNRGLGILSGCLGLLILLSSFYFPGLIPSLNSSSTETYFKVVYDVNDLNRQLAAASAAKKPVILDFYADWCESCVTMDKQVFNQSEVQQSLNHYILLRADLSENNTEDEALLKKYSVIAPPTVLFFDPYGKEINDSRIVGEVDAKEFLHRFNVINLAIQCGKDKKINC